MDDFPGGAVISSITRARDIIAASVYRIGNELLLPSEGDALITGDLHGEVESYRRIVAEADLAHNPLRHLFLQELTHGRDSTDGNDGSCALIEGVAALVNSFPDRVHVLMGNHEMAELTGRTIIKEGVVLNAAFRRGAAAKYGDCAEEVLESIRSFWRSLPLAARTSNRLFISHSTPSRRHIDAFDPSVLRRPLDDSDFSRHDSSVYALLWGRDFSADVAQRLCALLDADFFVVGHTPCDNGFSAPNGRHVILDSQGPNGKYLLVPLTGPLTYETILGNIRPIWT